MAGFRSKDDVVYLADCLSSKSTLEKYKITFIYDVEKYIETLKMVKDMKAALFIPSHADAAENISELTQLNIDTVYETAEKIIDICKTPVVFETLLQKLFSDYALAMNFEQYVLVGSTVRSYLTWLQNLGRVEPVFRENMLLWKS